MTTHTYPRSIADIKHTYYINLDTRTDRREHVEHQLEIIGIQAPIRFNAIRPKTGNGAIGCTMSHIALLQHAIKHEFDHILIVEDDITFTQPAVFIEQFNGFLSGYGAYRGFDVAIICGNNVPPHDQIDVTCVKVRSCQTTTGYLVAGHYFQTLLANFREGLDHLLREPEKHAMYAIDKYWFRLQGVDNWYLIIPLTVKQLEGYSDIEKRHTDYSRVMLDLDKTEIMKYMRQRAAAAAAQLQTSLPTTAASTRVGMSVATAAPTKTQK